MITSYKFNQFRRIRQILLEKAASPGLAALLLATVPFTSHAQTEAERFDINRFVIEGNSLLEPEVIDAILQPYTGSRREYADVQRASAALVQQYSNEGFNIVWVVVPEQDLDQGVVTLRVIEAQIGEVSVEGNRHFDESNIRAAVPALVESTSPTTRDISANVQLANENPARQLDVVLRAGAQEGVVDAIVFVIDEPVLKFFTTLDNTGNPQTGDYRLGLGVQHANLFSHDHVGTLNFITSPGRTSQVSQYSASYRVPLYSRDDSLDFIAAYSDVDAGVTQTVAGPLAFSGKGAVYGFRYNQLLPRRGEYSHQLNYGIDYRAYENVCSLGVFGEAGCGPAAVDVTTRPISLSYSGNWARPGRISEFYLMLSHNLPGASNGDSSDFAAARPSPAGGSGAPSRYQIMRTGASIVQDIGANWQGRVAVNAQLSPDALITGEQLGSAGATTVRGFLEREIARDTGYIANIELYSPNLIGTLIPGEGNLRALMFYDTARTRNNPLAGEERQNSSIASVGAGLRWNLQRNLNVRFDLARVIDSGGSKLSGDYRGHISVYFGL